MDITEVNNVSGPAPQSNTPQAPILVRPSETGGQSVDGLLPTTPLAPASIPPTAVLATPPLVPTPVLDAQPLTTAPPVPSTPAFPSVTTSVPPQVPVPPRTVDAIQTQPPVPGGVSPNPIAIDKVFETPEDAKAQMVSQVPPVTELVPAEPAPATVKKRSRPSLPILIGLIAGGMILIAGVTFITVSMLSKKPASSASSTSTLAQPVVMNSSDVISIVSKAVPGSTSVQNLSGPSYQVPKATYSVVPPAEAAISYPAVDTAAALVVYGKILPILKSNGLTERAVVTGATKSNTGGIFDAAGTHCQVTTGVKTLVLACSNGKTYEDLSTKLAPIYTVYTAARPVDKTKQPQALIVARWVASKTQGYNVADVSTTDTLVGSVPVNHLFYQSPDKSWHYVGETLSTTGCGNFNTPDLKKAFLGEPCMNGATKATVVLQ